MVVLNPFDHRALNKKRYLIVGRVLICDIKVIIEKKLYIARGREIVSNVLDK